MVPKRNFDLLNLNAPLQGRGWSTLADPQIVFLLVESTSFNLLLLLIYLLCFAFYFKLLITQLFIGSSHHQQFFVGAVFHYAPILHNINTVGGHYG